jgi:hypothetical protein
MSFEDSKSFRSEVTQFEPNLDVYHDWFSGCGFPFWDAMIERLVGWLRIMDKAENYEQGG